MFFQRLFPAFVWAFLILFSCGLPGDELPGKGLFEGFDKVVHGFLFSILVLLLIVGFIRQSNFRWLRNHPVLLAVAFAFGYGILIEVLQGTIFISRHIELMDVLANGLGSLVGVSYFFAIYGKVWTRI